MAEAEHGGEGKEAEDDGEAPHGGDGGTEVVGPEAGEEEVEGGMFGAEAEDAEEVEEGAIAPNGLKLEHI